jgi:hypothetical protein
MRLSACLLAMCLASSGCAALEMLSPQQMWKLNRQPNMDRGDAYFSIPAEIDPQSSKGDEVTKLEAPDPGKARLLTSPSESNPKPH